MTEAALNGTLGIGICLVLSAFFSGSETALTSMTPAHARRMMEEQGSRFNALQAWLDRPLWILTTILIGNNIVNIAASALATSVAATLLADTNVPFVNPISVAIGVMTLLLLTFGEITPKTLARANYERLAVPVLILMRPFYVLFYPVTAIYIQLSRALGRWTGAEVDMADPYVREEDIEYLVRIGGREGSITGERERMLRSIFAFTDTTAREVMVPRTDVVAIAATADEEELLKRLLEAGHSRVPVYSDGIDNIIGLCYAKDLLRFASRRKGSEKFEIARFLRRANFVPETKLISDLLREMQENRIHMAIVVDEFGGFSGIVTLEDIIEEFFGDILDEYDVESEWTEAIGDGLWRFDARINLSDLGDVFQIEVPDEEDCDTLGGYISKVMGEVAHRGAVVEAWGIRFEVEDADERRIKQVRAEWIGTEEPSDEDDAESASNSVTSELKESRERPAPTAER